MDMDCSTAREALWPPEKPRLAGEPILEARRHVEGCAACQEYFQQDRRILDAYDRLRETRAPRHVRERVFDVLAHERSGARGTDRAASERTPVGAMSLPGWMVGVAASLVLLSTVGTGAMWVNRPPGAREGGDLFVDDYLRRAVGQDNIVTSDPAEIARFLAKELGLPITPMQVEGLRLAGAEVCFLDGRRGAMIRYRSNGQEVAHYLIPREGVAARAPRPSHIRPEGMDGQGSPSVITWATPSLEQALVGEIPAEQLLAIVRGAPSL